jgi:hypothetical protein
MMCTSNEISTNITKLYNVHCKAIPFDNYCTVLSKLCSLIDLQIHSVLHRAYETFRYVHGRRDYQRRCLFVEVVWLDFRT